MKEYININDGTEINNKFSIWDAINLITFIIFTIGFIYWIYMIKYISIYISDFINLSINKITIHQVSLKTLDMFILTIINCTILEHIRNNQNTKINIKNGVIRIILSIIVIAAMIIIHNM